MVNAEVGFITKMDGKATKLSVIDSSYELQFNHRIMTRIILITIGISALFLQEATFQTDSVYAGSQSGQRSANAPFQWNWKDWQELMADQSLRKAKLTNRQRSAIARAIADNLRPMCFGPDGDCFTNMMSEIKTEAELENAVLDTRVTLIDLNGDGIPEVVAQGMVNCGATGNCPLWVLRKIKQGYELILEGEAQTFTIQNSSSNGFRDIVLSRHGSVTSGDVTLYRFEKEVYRDVGYCSYDWTVLDGDKLHELKEPQLTACR